MITLTINGKKVKAEEKYDPIRNLPEDVHLHSDPLLSSGSDTPRLLQALHGGGIGKWKDPYGHGL